MVDGRSVARLNPLLLLKRTKCFIETVSPARKRGRSNTVCAITGPAMSPPPKLNSHGLMPLFQEESTKDKSLSLRAVTSRPEQLLRYVSGNSSSMWAMPLESVLPSQSFCPSQVEIRIAVLPTGLALSSLVTQTSEDSRPFFR